MHAAHILALVALAAFLPASIHAQLCDTSSECCFANNILVEQIGNVVTVEGSLEGDCDATYDKATIVCAATGLQCNSAQGAIVRAGSTLSISPAAAASVINATCIDGACLTEAATLAGVYLVETTLDWRYYDGSLYVVRSRLDTFANQQLWCQSIGGDLASINSPEENEFVYNLRPVPSFSRWIGAEIITHSPLVLKWTDGTPYVDFSSDSFYTGCRPAFDCLFQKDEPNNFFGDELCLSMGHIIKTTNPSGWNDATCTERKYAVCEKPVTCDASVVGLDTRAIPASCDSNFAVGNTCTATCEPGFEGGSATLTCQETGLYDTAAPVCTPVDCGIEIPNLDENASSDCESLIDTAFGGQPCAARCNSGYVADSGTGIYTCAASGQWTGSLTCRLVDCGNTPQTLSDNVVADCSGGDTRFMQQACQASCAPGFEPATGDGVYTCQADGQWTGALTCKRLDCGDTIPNLDPNAVPVTCSGDTQFAGDACRTTCKEGYEPVSVFDTGVFTCGTSGQWAGRLECQRITCGATPAMLSPQVSPVGGACVDVKFESTCNVECAPGYVTATGSPSYTCQADGSYTGSFSCRRLSCGGAITTLDSNARVANRACSSPLFGDACEAECVEGYVPALGSTTYVCGADGQWQGNLQCARRDCGVRIPQLTADALPSQRVEDAFQPDVCSTSLFGDVCSGACQEGYELASGSFVFTCNAMGNWEGDFACRGVDCGAEIQTLGPNAISGNCSLAGSTRFGDGALCGASCEEGYVVESGSAAYTCGADGQWQGDLTCTPVDCGAKPSDVSDNVVVECTGDTRFKGDACQAQCAPGYISATGDGIYTCQANGEWAGSLTCQPRDCGLFIPDLNDRASATCGGDTTFGGDPCIATCNSGFRTVSGTSRTYVCGTDGVWTGNLGCMRVDCGDEIDGLHPNADASCEQGDTRFGAVCTATCNPGYETEHGDGNFTCVAVGDGSMGNWTGSLSCSPVDCGNTIPGLNVNANANCTGNTAFDGDHCVATCNTGYTGGSAAYTCGTDGQWQGSLTCAPVICGDVVTVSTVEFLDPTCINGVTVFGGLPCEVACLPGYNLFVDVPEPCDDASSGCSEGLSGEPSVVEQLQASVNFTCEASGSLTGPSIDCRAKDCNFFIPGLDRNARGNCIGLDTTFGGEPCVAVCNPNYLPVEGRGDGVYVCNSDGVWTGGLECALADCGAFILDLDENASADCAAGGAVTTFGGDNCTASCNPGYDGGSAMFVCDGLGRWQGELSCEAKDCGNVVNSVPNSVSDCSLGDTTFGGDSCVVECEVGFESTAGDGVFTCNTDGEWEGELTCTLVDCGEAPANLDENASFECEDTTFGNQCSASCNFGYNVEAGTGTHVCGADGNWAGSLQCKRVSCGNLGDVIAANTVVASEDAACLFNLNSCLSASVSCAPGYEPVSGDGEYTCGLNGQWTGELRCRRKNCGVGLGDALDENASHQICVRSLFGDGCRASCNPGYVRVEGTSPDFTCGADGAWVGDLACQRVSCGSRLPSLPAAATSACGSQIFFGDTCQATCASNLVQAGSNVFVCGADGQWRGGCGLECVDPSGYAQLGNSLYELRAGPTSFDAAEIACIARDAHLASVNSIEENDVVYNLQPDAVTPRWIGARLIRTATPQVPPFNYVWTDGTPYAPFDGAFIDGEPNDFRGKENCVSMGRTFDNSVPNRWNDADCQLQQSYVCERDLNPTPSLECVARYDVAFTASGPSDAEGTRFSTAFDASAQVFTLSFGEDELPGTALVACQARCTASPVCLGLFFQVLVNRFECFGLSDLGARALTFATGTSFVKEDVPVPEFPMTTTTAAPTTTTTITTAASTTTASTTRPITATSTAATTTTTSTPSSCEEIVTRDDYTLAFQGQTACNEGEARRFTTVFDAVATISTSRVRTQSDLDACFVSCSSKVLCRGVYQWTTAQGGKFCRLLSDAGENEGLGTSMDSYSWLKKAGVVPPVVTTTGAVTTTTTTSDSDSCVARASVVGYTLTFQGATDCNRGNARRFSTVFSSAATISTIAITSASERAVCFVACSSAPLCRGVFEWTTLQQETFCRLLRDTGSSSGVGTSISAYSYTKV